MAMKSFLLLLLLLTACHPASDPTEADTDYTLAHPAYVVLAQKALTYQADFDADAWANLLADSVVYYPPEGQPPWRGKAAVVAGWQGWRQRTGVRAMHLSGQTHLPLVLAQGLGPWPRPGVYVISYYTARLELGNGPHRQLRLSQYCHFDADKRIDLWMTFQ